MTENSRADEISVEDALFKGLDRFRIIDVRSPKEFAADHIPGAVNIPILNDEERAAVGTVYKNMGTRSAKMLGVELLSPRLPEFIKKIDAERNLNKNILISCWRGGLRSEAAATLANLAGIRTLKLKGGYAAFRRKVFSFFEDFPKDIKFIALFGATGCGKSEILRNLARKGYPVIDLERQARHKGSAFGDIGEKEYPGVTQKNFETGLWMDFYQQKASKIFFIEGESPRIGKVTVPKNLYLAMRAGLKIKAEAPLDFRIDFTFRAYEPLKYSEEIASRLKKIEKYIGGAKTAELSEAISQGRYEDFARFLLLNYYDPMYKNAFPKNMNKTVSYRSIEEGTEKLELVFQEAAASYLNL